MEVPFMVLAAEELMVRSLSFRQLSNSTEGKKKVLDKNIEAVLLPFITSEAPYKRCQ